MLVVFRALLAAKYASRTYGRFAPVAYPYGWKTLLHFKPYPCHAVLDSVLYAFISAVCVVHHSPFKMAEISMPMKTPTEQPIQKANQVMQPPAQSWIFPTAPDDLAGHSIRH